MLQTYFYHYTRHYIIKTIQLVNSIFNGSESNIAAALNLNRGDSIKKTKQQTANQRTSTFTALLSSDLSVAIWYKFSQEMVAFGLKMT